MNASQANDRIQDHADVNLAASQGATQMFDSDGLLTLRKNV